MIRFRSSGGRVSAASARAAPAAKSRRNRARSRSIPAGSGPRATTSTDSAAAIGTRLAATCTAPSANTAGCSARTGRGLWNTVTCPASASAANSVSCPSCANPSDSQ